MEAEVQPPVEIPSDVLSEEAFQGIIDEFIQREGTDYGVVEVSHEAKVQRVHKQLTKGDVLIVFDPNTESVTLLTAKEFEKLKRQPPPRLFSEPLRNDREF